MRKSLLLCPAVTALLLQLLFFVGVATGTTTTHSTLRAAAQGRIYMGSAIGYPHLFNKSDPTYTKVFREQFNLATAENECKVAETQPERNVFNFGRCDAVLQQTLDAGAVFRLHNLCWTNYNPRWMTHGNFSTDELVDILRNHVSTLIRRYYGRYSNKTIVAVDVVNEAVSDTCIPSSQKTMFKKADPWYPAVPNYVDIAFHAARNASRDAVLFYNDYNIATINDKSDCVYKMIKSMKQRGVPIDGVGFQFHLAALADVWLLKATLESFRQNLRRFQKLGVMVHITELDVACFPPCNTAAAAKQAQIYGNILNVALEEKEVVKSFEVWEFTDKYSWLNDLYHEDVRPLPFSSNYSKRPAFFSLLDRLNK